MNSNNYIMKFGKFKNMRAVDIAQIKTVNKLGNLENTGINYLKFIVGLDWFRHATIVQKVIDEYKEDEKIDININDNNDTDINAVYEEQPEPKDVKHKNKKTKSNKKIDAVYV